MKGSRDSELQTWDILGLKPQGEVPRKCDTSHHKSNPLCCAAVGSTDSRRRDDAHGALSRQGYLFCSAQNAMFVGCRLLSCLLSEFGGISECQENTMKMVSDIPCFFHSCVCPSLYEIVKSKCFFFGDRFKV